MFFNNLKKNDSREMSKLMESGFHGDEYLQKLVCVLLEKCDYFVETGTNVGSTLAYVAKMYPHITCISCEPHKESYEEAIKNTSDYDNVTIYNITSQELIKILSAKEIFDKNILFWLDAHGYGFEWPLKEEIAFITKEFNRAYVLIDDFKIPDKEMFGWDEYNDQICSFEYIKDSIFIKDEVSLYYPSYTEKTSAFHPLRGWCLISFGYDKINHTEILYESKY